VTNSIKSSHPIGLSLLSGSLSPEFGKNPSFNVIDIDAEYLVPINIHTYYMNLTHSNLKSQINPQYRPEWLYLHDYLQEY
jgi:translation initiation factor RLI1